MSRVFRPKADGDAQHLEWQALTEVSGPFLTMPVLRKAWPSLDSVDKPTREALNVAHAEGGQIWVDWVLNGLLEWGDRLGTEDLSQYAYTEAQHDSNVTPAFLLDDPDGDTPRLLGLTVPAGTHPHARIKGEAWPATPVDRMALLCRHHDVPLGLVTDGRWWALIWAKRGAVTTSCVFDTATWPDSSDRVVVRAFRSLLHRSRFFAVPDGEDGSADERLPALLEESGKDQEDVTDALGVQVRRAVEMLVDAIGRADLRERAAGGAGLGDVTAAEVYQASVSVMMRVVFLLFAEERGLLPADNPIYAAGYSASGLADELKQRADQGSESELEHSHAAWRRLAALFTAVHGGVDHPRMHLPAYDGSIFDPSRFPWLSRIHVDDRTVLHTLMSVQYVVVRKELRRLSFRALDVEQIGYVYEGLLSYDGFRAAETMVGLIGRDGSEEEVTLVDMERIGPDAAALAERFKDSGIGSVKALERKLAQPDAAGRTTALHRLLAVTDGERDLAERLLPFAGVVRDDLRGLPTIILPGSLYVTSSSLRADTGTHYTPRFLAEQVVEGALEPLVYTPGPLQTADRTQWKLKSSDDILRLKVADIAMGSGAFLVAACRYLATRLVDAWTEEGDECGISLRDTTDVVTADAEADPVMIDARRKIIEHCLYGVDINSMAVEMAKLSLWLVSMDPRRPFTFLDDRLACGDSLLGVTSLDQVETMHLDPVKGRAIHERGLIDFTTGVRERVAEVAALRRQLADLPGDTVDELAAKRSLLAQAEATTSRVRLFADLAVGAALANASRGERTTREGSVAAANAARIAVERDDDIDAIEHARAWLATDQPHGGLDREPMHWPLAFPEVTESGGFDAVIGNPPFLGGTMISGTLGPAYRSYLVSHIAARTADRCDLVGYFVLRAHSLLKSDGQTGLVATNTLAQGDTRETSLDQLVANGVTIRQAVKSKPWPSRSAALQYCALWTSHNSLDRSAARVLDDEVVPAITTSLDIAGRVAGSAKRLSKDTVLASQGTKLDGVGFTMSSQDARSLIDRDSRNGEVLFRYLNGQDLNSRPGADASRWVINFRDWPIERAAAYAECFEQVDRLVRPARATHGEHAARTHWWRFQRSRPELYTVIATMKRAIVLTRHSKAVMPMLVPTGQVFSDALVVFGSDDTAMLGLLSSAPHYWWAIRTGSSIKGDLRYTPSDIFETLARPELTPELRALGERLDIYRREVMQARNTGLTATYNLVHSPKCMDADITELRRIHVAIDMAVAHAYSWNDLVADGLGHGFHETRQGTRYTVGAAVRQEILDRLLELNHERHAAEQASGAAKKRGRPAPALGDPLSGEPSSLF